MRVVLLLSTSGSLSLFLLGGKTVEDERGLLEERPREAGT
jgi:hypothetical protein